MNRIDQLFQDKKNNIFSVYFTAGYPEPDSAPEILQHLQSLGVDLVEIGMPFSDPLADGPVIQESSTIALKEGMSVKKLFSQLKDIRKSIDIPLILMGYLNPVMQFGIEKFCEACRETGIDGVILPDLPLDEYQQHYHQYFETNGLHFIFLITPQTTNERIKLIDSISKGFIYMVSSASTTGAKSVIADKQIEYFDRVKSLQLKNPLMIGFGISNKVTFERACNYANGAIIGSAFIKALAEEGSIGERVNRFVKTIV
jgi:tryptophan synthase alpha chain